MPNSEITVTMPSIQPLGCRAASRPSGMPRPTAKIRAPIVSSIVAGKRIRNVAATSSAVDEARAEVAVEQPADVADVLHVERLVEALGGA